MPPTFHPCICFRHLAACSPCQALADGLRKTCGALGEARGRASCGCRCRPPRALPLVKALVSITMRLQVRILPIS